MATIRETAELAASLLEKHGLAGEGWHFNWDNAKSRGGQCNHTYRRISMSRHLVPLWTDEQVFDTLIHEIAHALVGPKQGHGPVWAAKMREIGGKPERCHNNAVVDPPIHAVCDTHGVIAKRHRRTRGAICLKCRVPVVWVDTRKVRV